VMVMSSRFHETPLATFVVTTALAVVTTNARADGPKRHKVDEQEMTNERVLRPHVAELIEQGEAALRGNELERAADLFHRASARAREAHSGDPGATTPTHATFFTARMLALERRMLRTPVSALG